MKNQQQNQKEQSQPAKQGKTAQKGSNHGAFNTGEKEPKTTTTTAAEKQQGGYSSAPEKKETKREQEKMHNERDNEQLDADRHNLDKPQQSAKAGKNTTTDYSRTAPKPGQAGRHAQR